ncbi:MAG: hypothetical protein ACR652_19545 [Methylocystis sp.]|uniref:hypothetical protein n=1 Tax=Methylocystis sp. TaxID=1911079 RepID=UPI003DA56764
MSDFEQNSHPNRYQSSTRSSMSGAVWNVAALSAFAFLLSVLGAKLLSHWVDSDAASRLAYNRAMRDVAANGAPQTPQAYSIVRSIGVDGITTATIPLRKASPVSPCGDSKSPDEAGK